MFNKRVNSQLLAESRFRSWLAPHQIALILLWLTTSISMIVMLMNGVQETNSNIIIRHSLHAMYVGVLLWYLTRTGPSINQLPEFSTQVSPGMKIGVWLPVLGIALLFLLNIVSDDGRDLLILLSIVASVVILVVWIRDISLRLVIQGLAVAFFAYLVGLQWVNMGVLSKSWNIIMCAFSLLFYVAGGLLLKRTRLGGVQLMSGQYGQALKSVCVGILLFAPLGLINALGDSSVDLTAVREWWMPLWLPWWSGINEETWFRLYLVGLIFFLLRPAFRKHLNLAVIAAVLFSGTTVGVGHGRTLGHFLPTGLLYGVPFAAIFAKRDWEHAVGAHYMVNMIPALLAFLFN